MTEEQTILLKRDIQLRLARGHGVSLPEIVLSGATFYLDKNDHLQWTWKSGYGVNFPKKNFLNS